MSLAQESTHTLALTLATTRTLLNASRGQGINHTYSIIFISILGGVILVALTLAILLAFKEY
mgnify:CR=1 FL=1